MLVLPGKRLVGILLVTALFASSVAGGCPGPVSSSQQVTDIDPDRPDPWPTPIESRDLRQMSDQMVREILQIPQVTNVISAGVPRIATLHVRNRSRHAFDTGIFRDKLRTALVRSAHGQIEFVERSRTAAIRRERIMKDEGEVDSSERRPRAGVDFFLTGEVRDLHKGDPRGVVDYMVFSFELINAESEVVVWAYEYETKRASRRGDVYSGKH